jgi:hypothetical protein
MGEAEQQRKHWHDFGVWLEQQALARYPSKAEFARAAGIAWHSVYDLFNGGRASGGGWRLPNPNDSTVRRIAKALNLKDAELFRRLGGTYKERNPDRTYPGQVAATAQERIAQLSEELQATKKRNEELAKRRRLLEETLRKAGIPVPAGAEETGSSRSKRRRSPS